MDWTAPLDLYCERTAPGFWNEPLNAASNLAFFVAAALALSEWRRNGGRDLAALGLIGLVASIGIGSFLFHTFANRWSVMADVIPITVFIYAMFAVVFRRQVGLDWYWTVISLAVFLRLNLALEGDLAPYLGGSAGYAPALFAMVVVAIHLYRQSHPFGRWLAGAAAVFAVSLTLRTLDLPLCEALPIGTHYFWHAVNAVTLWLLLTGTMRVPAVAR